MKKTITSLSLLFAACILFLQQVNSYSDGPPPARTGAPGELTCYNGYCHNSFLPNDSSGTPSIQLLSSLEQYKPDSIYRIRVGIRRPGMKRFGFQVSVRDAATKARAGRLFSRDDAETQVVSEAEKEYLMHQLAKVSADSAYWEFDWQAPSAGSGAVNIYAAFVAADSNGNRQGDYVYNTQLQIAENSGTTSISPNTSPLPKIRWMSHQQQLQIRFPNQQPLFYELSIIDLSGREILRRAKVAAQEESLDWTLPPLPKGLYFLRVSSAKGIAIHKFLY